MKNGKRTFNLTTNARGKKECLQVSDNKYVSVGHCNKSANQLFSKELINSDNKLNLPLKLSTLNKQFVRWFNDEIRTAEDESVGVTIKSRFVDGRVAYLIDEDALTINSDKMIVRKRFNNENTQLFIYANERIVDGRRYFNLMTNIDGKSECISFRPDSRLVMRECSMTPEQAFTETIDKNASLEARNKFTNVEFKLVTKSGQYLELNNEEIHATTEQTHATTFSYETVKDKLGIMINNFALTVTGLGKIKKEKFESKNTQLFMLENKVFENNMGYFNIVTYARNKKECLTVTPDRRLFASDCDQSDNQKFIEEFKTNSSLII